MNLLNKVFAAWIAFGVFAASAPAADVAAHFDGSGSSISPNTTGTDDFPGTAGDGWANAWTYSTTGPTTITATSPLLDGGNYLSVGQTGTARYVRRQLEPAFGGLDLSLPHVVEFNWRYDGSFDYFDGAGDSPNDRIHFFADSEARTGSQGSNSWLIGVAATHSSGKWYFYDRSDGSFTSANMHDTGMPLTAGDNLSVYAVKVIVDPTKGTYDAQIDRLASDGTRQKVVAADRLKFRNNQTTASAGPVGVDWLLFGANANSGSNNLSYSLDALRVTGRNYIWAGFDDGRIDPAQDTAIDTFDASADGIGGGGWRARWAVDGNAGDATVMMPGDAGFAPLEGPGDNYLSVNPSNNSDNNTIRRRAQNFGDVDLSQPHVITWKWRFDGDLTQMSTSGNRIHFFGDDTTPSGSTTTNSWLLGYHSGGAHGFEADDDQWYFFDSMATGASSNSFEKNNMVLTGLQLVKDEVYEFKVTVNPLTGTYDAEMFDGTNTFAATGLTFRNGTTGGTFDYLSFGTWKGQTVSNYQAYSLDSIKIAWIPEPGTGLLALLALAALLCMPRRGRGSHAN